MDDFVTYESVTVDDVFSAYLDTEFLEFLSSFVALVPAGLIASVIVFLAGWLVAWVFALLRKV